MYGRRRSSTRWVRRVVSLRLSSSIWKGGVTEGLSTLSSWHSTSIWPLLSLSLVVPSGRARTTPLTCTQNSLRTSSATLNISTVRGANHLHITFAIAQVDEDHTTVVTTTIDPTRQGNGLAQQGFGHETAIV